MSAADRLTLQANLYDLETLELCTVTTQAGSSGRQHAATCATFDVSLSRKMQSSIGACKIGTGSAAGASSGSSAEEKSESVSHQVVDIRQTYLDLIRFCGSHR